MAVLKEVISCDQADDYQRTIDPVVLGVCALAFLVMAFFFGAVEYHLPGLVLFSGFCAVTVLYAGVYLLKLRAIGRAQGAWRRVDGGVGLFPSASLRIASMMPAVVTIVTAVLLMLLWHAGAGQQTTGSVSLLAGLRVPALALLLLGVGMFEFFSILVTFAGPPVVLLTPLGILLRPKARRAMFVEWDESPEAVGATRSRTMILATARYSGVRVPLGDLRLDYGRIQQFVEFYSKNAGRRMDLISDAGLECVRRLMVQYAWEIEESLE